MADSAPYPDPFVQAAYRGYSMSLINDDINVADWVFLPEHERAAWERAVHDLHAQWVAMLPMPLTVSPGEWRKGFNPLGQAYIEWAERYAAAGGNSSPEHNALMTIAAQARLLDVLVPPAPESAPESGEKSG